MYKTCVYLIFRATDIDIGNDEITSPCSIFIWKVGPTTLRLARRTLHELRWYPSRGNMYIQVLHVHFLASERNTPRLVMWKLQPRRLPAWGKGKRINGVTTNKDSICCSFRPTTNLNRAGISFFQFQIKSKFCQICQQKKQRQIKQQKKKKKKKK